MSDHLLAFSVVAGSLFADRLVVCYFLNCIAYIQWEHDCERVNQDNSAF